METAAVVANVQMRRATTLWIIPPIVTDPGHDGMSGALVTSSDSDYGLQAVESCESVFRGYGALVTQGATSEAGMQSLGAE